MVVVVGDSPAEGVVSCSRVVVGAVGAFCGEPTFEGFAHRFGQECAGDGVSCRESVRVECSHAWRGPVACGKDAQLVISETSRRGGVRSGGVGLCCEESESGRVRASGVIASLRDEVVASVVIVVPSAQQACGCPTSVECCGRATRR